MLRRLRLALAIGAPLAETPIPVADDLAEHEDARLLFIRRLLERLGLLRVDTEALRLYASERSEMARYLASPLVERLRLCARLWVAGGWWPNRPALETGPGAPSRVFAPAPPRLALARRRVLDVLADHALGDEVAIPLAPLARGRTVGAKRERVVRERPSKTTLQTTGAAEAETLRAALLGPLAWVGFVALPPRQESAAHIAEATICYTGAALAALRPLAPNERAPLDERPGRMVAQADLSLLAFPPLTAQALCALDTCADEEALDATARYRLTRASLARASQAGWPVAEVIRRLEEMTQAPLPGNVRVTLQDWARHVERLRVTSDVSILEVRAPGVLDALLADRAASGWIARRLTPTAAVIAPTHADHLRQWLLRHGEFPALASAEAPD